MGIFVRVADLRVKADAEALVTLLDEYARDPMGGGKPLPAEVKLNLASRAAAESGFGTLLATVDGQLAGLLNYVRGFSSFRAAPLLNVHDVMVREGFRQKGVARALFSAFEDEARRLACCKVTLEVLSENEAAKRAYESFGFSPYSLDPSKGVALFWEKALHSD